MSQTQKTRKTILITGATAGIGRYLAQDLAQRGHRVIASGRNQAALERLAEEGIETVTLDVTSPASIEAARAELLERTGGEGPDVLINNAGYGHLGPTELVSDADLRAQFETNVFGLMAVTRAFVPDMRARGRGRILNVSSIGGRYTFPFFGVYSASKYAVEALSDALRMELGAFGIDVSVIEPGPIQSEFGERAYATTLRYKTPDSPYAAILERAEKIKAQADAGSVGPEHVARVVRHAVESRRPRVRYVAPRRANVLLALGQMLPTRLVDWAVRQAVGLTPRALAAPSRRDQHPQLV